ncbi:MAG: hypothetical protein ABJR10_06930, partial [Marinomonas sp.]
EQGGDGYYHYAMKQSLQHAETFRERGLSSDESQRFAAMREASEAAQASVETEQQEESFDDYLRRFYLQYQDL